MIKHLKSLMEHLGLEFQTKIEDNFELIKNKVDGLVVSIETQDKIMDSLAKENTELKAKQAPIE